MKYKIKSFFDKDTSTMTYIVYDDKTKDAVVIDPILNFDYADAQISYGSANELLNFISTQKLKTHWVLETHAHADHITGANYLKNKIPGLKIAIGGKITIVQQIFQEVFDLKDLSTNGEQFDLLLENQSQIGAGSVQINVITTPGHTPACLSYLIGEHLFVGDALFMPDSGTGRCDFPEGNSKELYHSIYNKLYQLDDSTKVYVGHDYQPNGRELKFQTTIKEQRINNIHITSNTKCEEFVEFRTKRDQTLSAPKLLLPSIQININGGKLPQKDNDGNRYLKIPLKE